MSSNVQGFDRVSALAHARSRPGQFPVDRAGRKPAIVPGSRSDFGVADFDEADDDADAAEVTTQFRGATGMVEECPRGIWRHRQGSEIGRHPHRRQQAGTRAGLDGPPVEFESTGNSTAPGGQLPVGLKTSVFFNLSLSVAVSTAG